MQAPGPQVSKVRGTHLFLTPGQLGAPARAGESAAVREGTLALPSLACEKPPVGRTPRTQGAVGRRRGSASAGRVSSTPERSREARVNPGLTRVCLEIWRDKCAFHCRPKKIHCPVHYNGTGTCSLDAINLIEGGECAKYAFPFASSRTSSPDML